MELMPGTGNEGISYKTAPTGAVVSPWWTARKKVEDCVHPVSMYTRFYGANIPPFYQEYCPDCGKVSKQEGQPPPAHSPHGECPTCGDECKYFK